MSRDHDYCELEKVIESFGIALTDDYGALDPGEELTKFITHLQATLARVEGELATTKKALLQSCSDQREYLDCQPTCDSYGHAENCEVANPGLAFHRLEIQLVQAEQREARLKAALVNLMANIDRVVYRDRANLRLGPAIPVYEQAQQALSDQEPA